MLSGATATETAESTLRFAGRVALIVADVESELVIFAQLVDADGFKLPAQKNVL